MILDQLPTVFSRGMRFKSVISLLFFFLLLSAATTSTAAKKSFLRLEQNQRSELNDFKITSIGGLVIEDNMEAHIDLLHLESDMIGNSMALDFGGGYVFGGDISLFLGVGISLDYNFDSDVFKDKYYSEAGVVLDITNRFSITARKQHFFHQADDYEEIIMMGLLFRH